MTTDELRSVLECLRAYHAYGEAMREHGRGFHPIGCKGESIDHVIESVRRAIGFGKDEDQS